jgi:deoxyribose-phosphate aldolase
MNIASYIDHTLLKPDATEAQITKLCEEAKTHQFKSVCINAVYIPLAKNHLKNSSVKICTVVGFPLGMSPTEVKLKETEWAISNGAQEIDMVICIGMVKNQNAEYVKNDIQILAQFCRSKNVILKVILETCLLTDEEKKWACKIALEAGAHFVKTSTGFSTGGATLHDIKLMKEVVKDKGEIKASGGIKNLKMAMEMIEAGATRLGTSSGVSLVQGSEMDSKSY